RDMLAMESINVPVRGEAGVGYVLEEGYDLPPLIFNLGELETLMLGARFVEKFGDPDQITDARNMVAKVSAVLPDSLREKFKAVPLYVGPGAASEANTKVDSKTVRDALRRGRVIELKYQDEAGRQTQRAVWPVSVGYFDMKRVMVAWCEKRDDFRAFRVDRIVELIQTDRRFPKTQAALKKEWLAREMAYKEKYS
ncbi:MAG: WYL domain-containing protein, partial [Parvibaculaceae bacterium]|nr:WYL domain-containing protein [Parvibaculaceae bacterium]